MLWRTLQPWVPTLAVSLRLQYAVLSGFRSDSPHRWEELSAKLLVQSIHAQTVGWVRSTGHVEKPFSQKPILFEQILTQAANYYLFETPEGLEKHGTGNTRFRKEFHLKGTVKVWLLLSLVFYRTWLYLGDIILIILIFIC